MAGKHRHCNNRSSMHFRRSTKRIKECGLSRTCSIATLVVFEGGLDGRDECGIGGVAGGQAKGLSSGDGESVEAGLGAGVTRPGDARELRGRRRSYQCIYCQMLAQLSIGSDQSNLAEVTDNKENLSQKTC